MGKYNVGDVVKLRDDLEDEQEIDIIAGTFVVDDEVLELMNIPLKIVDYKKKHGFYIVEFLDGKTGRICDEMIEGLWEEKKDKLKLIDVLNMIAKGELKEGTKVRYEDVEYTYKKFDSQDNDSTDLISDSSCSIFEDYFLTSLQDEVELIEPPCEHECIADIGKSIEPTKIEELIDWYELPNGLTSEEKIHIVWNKLNEVIRKINKE